MSKFTEYKVVHIVEGGCGTIFLGASGLPIQKMEAELNKYAQEGWQVVFQALEQKRNHIKKSVRKVIRRVESAYAI